MELSRATSTPLGLLDTPGDLPTPRAPDDPDDDVLELSRRGDAHAALTALVRRHGRAVHRYCREELGDPTLADDVHQQIFLQAYRDLPRFGHRSLLRTWLFGIARHRVLDAAKSRRRAEAHLAVEDDDEVDVADPTPPPDERLDRARLQRAMIGCLRDLPAQTRGALVLYHQGYLIAELAAVLGQKPGTLRTRMTRALPGIRTRVEAETGWTA